MTRRKRAGDRVSSTASSNNEDRAVSMIPRAFSPRFFLSNGIPNSKQVASHARSSNRSWRERDIIGDSSVPLLRSRFCRRSFLRPPSRAVATVAATFLFFARHEGRRHVLARQWRNARDYYLICIAVKLPGVNEITGANVRNLFNARHGRRSGRGILVGDHRAGEMSF